ncbi:hypothetical protein [Prescottella agglutinans]|uniref:Serine protease n=1 Tax=Prescottella agglutinans TaxID=1644129 RepID=A0ABT6MBC6_9NOCA|nr:hypothetical protein [Prescottella agglutinans]MDH6281612.1 hypothetical protein [Prescottella agglutinans]
MTKRILLTAAAALAALAPALAIAPTASAATGTVSNGIGWTAKPDAGPSNPMQNQEYCTLGVVGTDNLGNKIAISAGHCVSAVAGGATEFPDGATVYRFGSSGTGAPIGTIAYRDPHIDYVVIKLNPDTVLTSTGPEARIDSIGPSHPEGTLCKSGVRTGLTCGPIYGQAAPRINSFATANGGDSGGPAFVNGSQLVGMTRGPFEFIDFSAVLDSIAAQANPIGKGFVVTND